MTPPTFTDERSDAIRLALVNRVREHASRPVRRGRVVTPILAIGAILVLGAGGFSAAAASGLIGWPFLTEHPLPGGLTAESASRTHVQSGQGNAEVDLTSPPANATHVSVQFTCLTGGTFSWGMDPGGNNGRGTCPEDQIGTRFAISSFDFELTPGRHDLYIAADADSRWSISWVFLDKQDTEWGINAKGETYGVQKADGSSPDLIAVETTNGDFGYVYADELAAADGSQNFSSPEEALAWQEARKGTTVHVPVYTSDGATRIGDFDLVSP